MNTPQKIPVTVLTGFLGSGKTTLLNRILSEQHGKRIAVIENEYGQIGIDHELVINADEEIFEMSNGCICCSVRGDLIRVLGNLMKRRDKFDYVLVETTGLADPGPVAQTFFTDDEIREEYKLDGIITLVDAMHIEQQLDRSEESSEQIAFADVLLLNKTDLVDNTALDKLETRLRTMNRMARVVRSEQADVPVDTVLNLAAFDLDELLKRRPSFLESEYPFEWTGVYSLESGRHTLQLAEGPDPEMSLVIVPEQETDDFALREGAELCVRQYAEPPEQLQPGDSIPIGKHVSLQLNLSGRKSFVLELDSQMQMGLYAQHTAEEFELQMMNSDGVVVPATSERVWAAHHGHDDEVGSFAIEVDGDIDPDMFNEWLAKLLREQGPDLFRMKGFLSFVGEPERIVLQGVHMVVDGQPDGPWGDAPRRNQLVFIGRALEEESIRQGFEACLK